MPIENNEVRLEEFRQLKSEILKIFDRRSSIFNVATTITSALVAAAIAAKIPEISALASIIICTMWIDDNKLLNNTDRIGAYIRVVIEPNLPGLLWEKVHQKAMEERASTGVIRRIMYVIIYRYPVMAIISYIVTGILCFYNLSITKSLIVVASLLLISFILFIWAAIFNFKGVASIKKWNHFMKTAFAEAENKRIEPD